MSNDRYQKIRDALAGVAERESLRQRAAAWDAVADTLGEVCPEWINHPGTGTEAAVAAIRKLAQQPEARVGGEWELVYPDGTVAAREPTAIKALARLNGYKPTVEALLAYEQQGYRIRPATPPPSAVPQGWPRATKDQRDQGWTLEYRFLERVTDLAAPRTEYSTSMEATEQVLIAALEVLAAAPEPVEGAPVAVVECNDAKGAWLVTVDDAPLYKGQRVRIVPEPGEGE